MPRQRLGLALLFLVATAGLVRAQEQTAAIQGTVRDAHGGVVPGATVRIEAATGLDLESVSDRDGVYRFAALSPGRYALEAHLTAFAPARVEGIDLRLGQLLTIDVEMEVASVSESVEVVSDSPLIPITQSSHNTSLRDEQIDKMPRGRDHTTLIVQVPGVVDEPRLGGYSIDGASGSENRFIIDGAEYSTNRWGWPIHVVVTDFVDEVQVKSSGYSAEFGGATGGVINAITRSGTNAWHGDALLYWSSDALDADPRPSLRLAPTGPPVAEYVTYPEDRYDGFEPGFTLSGPIVRDKAWFFAGYIPEFRSLDRTVTFLANDETREYRRTERIHKLAASVTAQLDPRWRLRASLTSTPVRWTGALPEQDGTGDPAGEYDFDEAWSLASYSGSIDFTPSPHALVSLRAGYFREDYWTEGVYEGDQIRYRASSVGFPGVPPEYQQPFGYQNVPTNFGADRHLSDRLAVQLDGTLFFDGAGQHQVKGGVQLDRIGLDMLYGSTGNVLDIFWGGSFGGAEGPFGFYQVMTNDALPNRGQITAGESSVTNVGLFVQDSWRIGSRLTLNLGLRTENERLPSYSEDPELQAAPIEFGFDQKLAPRLGFAWDVWGDARSRLYGSWGVFYDVMKLELAVRSFGAEKLRLLFYSLDDPNLSTIENNPDCPPACPGELLFDFDYRPPNNDTVVPDLEPMKLQEAAVGYEHQLRSNLSIGARYIHKQLDRAVEDVCGLGESNDLDCRIANPGFGEIATYLPVGATEPVTRPRAQRDYDAVEVTLNKRMSGGWSGRLAYTWSRLYGNYSGLANSDFMVGAANPNYTAAFDSPFCTFDETGEPVSGVLPTDRTHRIKAHLIADFRFGTTVGLSWYGGTGIPRTRTAFYVSGLGFDVRYRGRDTDGRMPFVSQLDLYVQHQIPLSDRTRLTLSANVMNLFDQATPVNYFQRELLRGQTIALSEAEYVQGVDTQQLIAEQGLERDPRFLMDWAYQPPRSIRLGVSVGF
jgi:hypothetical protein